MISDRNAPIAPEPAVPDDVEAILTLRDRAAAWMEAQGAVGWAKGEMPRERLAARIEKGEVFVVRDQGEVVAGVTVLDEDPDFWGERGHDGTAGYIHMLVRDRERSRPGSGSGFSAGPRPGSRNGGGPSPASTP